MQPRLDNENRVTNKATADQATTNVHPRRPAARPSPNRVATLATPATLSTDRYLASDQQLSVHNHILGTHRYAYRLTHVIIATRNVFKHVVRFTL